MNHTHIPTHSGYQRPSYFKNLDTYFTRTIDGQRVPDDRERCLCCGKPVDDNIMVHMLTSGELIPMDLAPYGVDDASIVEGGGKDTINGAQSQGCFPVGSDCARRLPKGFAQ